MPLLFVGVGTASCEKRQLRRRICRIPASFQEEFGTSLPPWIVARLETLGFHDPTEVQRRVLGAVLADKEQDVVIHSKTGSGKTLAYLLPVFAGIDPARASLQAAIIVPTQELGIQVYRVARRLAAGWSMEGSEKKLVVMPLLGQADLRRQKLQLRETAPRIVIGTMQRMIDLERSGRLPLDSVNILVVDEFDACLADTETTSLLREVLQLRADDTKRRRTFLASATVPQHKYFLRTCVREKWTKPSVEHIWIDSDEKIPESIHHSFVVCEPSKKLLALGKLIHALQPSSAIAFFHDSRDVEVIADQLRKALKAKNEEVTALSWNSSLADRKRAMALFRNGESKLLVATDVAARGLDIPEVTYVFNVDLPEVHNSYVHRAGRTGRQGRPGTVCSICGTKERFVLERIANVLELDLQRLTNDDLRNQVSDDGGTEAADVKPIS